MSAVSERWHDWRYDGRGYYLVNDPEITFQDDAEADAYCDEHNRALVGQAAAEERAKIVAWLRNQDGHGYDDVRANCIEAGEHLK
jgi:hypothetical protein